MHFWHTARTVNRKPRRAPFLEGAAKMRPIPSMLDVSTYGWLWRGSIRLVSRGGVYASLYMYALPRMHTCTRELNRTRGTVRSWRTPSVLRWWRVPQYRRSTSGGRIGASEPAPPAQPSRTWRVTREFHPRATRSAPVMLGLARILSLRLVAARRCAAHGPMLPTGPSAPRAARR